MITGAAPLSDEVKDFFKIAMGCPMMEAYGQTELTGVSHLTEFLDPRNGQVGGVSCTMDCKLVDVPEMDYLSTDQDENGNPAPRGEICVKGPPIIRDYYKNAEKTKEAIDEEGWLHTGDIGMILPTGGFKVIDRKKNIFKLQQGEYVAPEKVENIYV